MWLSAVQTVLPFAVDMATLLGAASLVIAPLVAYAAANRRLSGSIQTSEASDLWEEVERQRTWSQERIDSLTALCRELEAKNDALEERILELERDNASLHAENKVLREQLDSRV